ncbi:MAG: hypothetical protein PHU14_04915, partial [Methylovulum sp.]|nr:hypothetical protein [Methylovulum sp.]
MSGHAAKHNHASPKKSPAAVAKPSRKHSVIPVKHSEPRTAPHASPAKYAALRSHSVRGLVPVKHTLLRQRAAQNP